MQYKCKGWVHSNQYSEVKISTSLEFISVQKQCSEVVEHFRAEEIAVQLQMQRLVAFTAVQFVVVQFSVVHLSSVIQAKRISGMRMLQQNYNCKALISKKEEEGQCMLSAFGSDDQITIVKSQQQ